MMFNQSWAKKDGKVAEDASAKEIEAKAAAAKAEEEEFERIAAEIEAREAEREKKIVELLLKRSIEKEAYEQANAEMIKAAIAENDRMLREQEAEMERLEDERQRKREEAGHLCNL